MCREKRKTQRAEKEKWENAKKRKSLCEREGEVVKKCKQKSRCLKDFVLKNDILHEFSSLMLAQHLRGGSDSSLTQFMRLKNTSLEIIRKLLWYSYARIMLALVMSSNPRTRHTLSSLSMSSSMSMRALTATFIAKSVTLLGSWRFSVTFVNVISYESIATRLIENLIRAQVQNTYRLFSSKVLLSSKKLIGLWLELSLTTTQHSQQKLICVEH